MPGQTIPTPEKSEDNRGLWRVGNADLDDYVAEAYRVTAEKIAAGEIEGDLLL